MLSLGSSAQLGIGISIALQDKFSGTAAVVSKSLADLKNKANDAVTSSMRAYRNNAAGIAASALGASYAIGSMVKDAAEFQQRINQVTIVGGKALGLSRKNLTSFANDMAQVYGKSPTEIASAMFENAKAGITTNMKEITEYQMTVATATKENLEGPGGVAETLIGIMNAYNMSSSKFADISNAITSVANATISSVSGIGHSMQYAAFTAKNFNIPLEMTLAMVGKLSQANIQGSAAGTGINNMLLQLAKSLGPLASKKSQKIWGMLGLDRGAMADMMNKGNISGVIQALSGATGGMTPINRTALLSDLFQRRGDRALEGIFNTKNGITLDQLYRGAMGDEKRDLAKTQAQDMMKGLAGSMLKLNAAWTVFKNVLVEGITPGLVMFLHVLTSAMKPLIWFAGTFAGKFIFGITAILLPLIGILFAFRAAAFTAAIALNSFGMTARAGGFRGLLGAGLDIASQTFGGSGSKGIMMNKAGRAYVGAGQRVNYMGKIWKAGSLLPMSAVGAMGTAGTVSGLGSIAVGIGRLLPIVGAILTIATVVSAIYDYIHWGKTAADKARDGRIMSSYSAPSSGRTFGDSYVSSARAGNWIPSQAQQDAVLKQTINLHVDGKQVMSQQIDQKMSDDMNNQIDFNPIGN